MNEKLSIALVIVLICGLVVSGVYLYTSTWVKKAGTLNYDGLHTVDPFVRYDDFYVLYDSEGNYVARVSYITGGNWEYRNASKVWVGNYQPPTGSIYYYQNIFGVIRADMEIR